MEWNKSKLLDFFRQHSGKKIVVEESGGTLRIQGKLKDLVETDMCSRILFEASLVPEIPGTEISLTLHEGFLGIHLTASSPEVVEPLLSCPAQISYEKLSISIC